MDLDRFKALSAIAAGDVDAIQAHKIMRPYLDTLDATSAQKIYAALRSWLWKAVNERRRDQQLQEWYKLLRLLADHFSDNDMPHGERIRVLYELLHESISIPDKMPINDILRRTHVQEIITLIGKSPSGKAERALIHSKLGLKHANLSRVLNLLLSNGVLDRHIKGKAAFFSLTAEGLKVAQEFIGKREPVQTGLPATPKHDPYFPRNKNIDAFVVYSRGDMDIYSSFKPAIIEEIVPAGYKPVHQQQIGFLDHIMVIGEKHDKKFAAEAKKSPRVGYSINSNFK